MRRFRLDRPFSALAALAIAAALLGLVLVDGSGELMAALPAALLAIAIAFKRYPGEKLLLRLARVLRRRPRRARRAISHRTPEARGLGILPLLAGVRPLRGPPTFSSPAI